LVIREAGAQVRGIGRNSLAFLQFLFSHSIESTQPTEHCSEKFGVATAAVGMAVQLNRTGLDTGHYCIVMGKRATLKFSYELPKNRIQVRACDG